MADALLWGLIQGLTEFLPISSSGHLVLVPALLDRAGPDLATSAVLHLGTLAAVLAYYRRDVMKVIRFDDEGRFILKLLIIGTIPAAVIGLLFEGPLDRMNETPRAVAVALMVTGVILIGSRFITIHHRVLEDSTIPDAVLIGLGQATALIPGVSRSGMTITTGLGRRFGPIESARYSFLLGIPAIAGAGFLQLLDLGGEPGGVSGELWLGVVAAAVSGYLAIAVLVRLITRIGLAPFGVYCVIAGAIALALV
ncbi:MAG: undecaprenyl-diphosphate phosphatase, partial [Acidimicrobiia bacterium]|nr:undecaprenyl-diphosphate phosphatase [Acidimicrobiia bacterium]